MCGVGWSVQRTGEEGTEGVRNCACVVWKCEGCRGGARMWQRVKPGAGDLCGGGLRAEGCACGRLCVGLWSSLARSPGGR